MENVEGKFISALLQTSDIVSEDILRSLSPEYFTSCRKEAEFIWNFYDVYQKLPLLSTFLSEFPYFEIEDKTETLAYLAEKVEDKRIFSLHKESLARIVRSTTDEGYTGKQLHSALSDALSRVEVKSRNKEVIPWSDVGDRFERYSEQFKGGGDHFYTPFESMNYAINRLSPGEILSLFARPSVGKTWISCLFSYYASVKQGLPTGFISLEMTQESLKDRIDAIHLKLPWTRFNRCDLTFAEYVKWKAGSKEIAKNGYPLYLIGSENPTFTLSDVESLVSDYGLKFLIIDGMHHISTGGRNRTETMYDILSGMTILTQRKNIMLFQTMQRGRPDEKKAKRDQVAWSDAVLQDSDILVLLDGDETSPYRSMEFQKIRNGIMRNFEFKMQLNPTTEITEKFSDNDYLEIDPNEG